MPPKRSRGSASSSENKRVKKKRQRVGGQNCDEDADAKASETGDGTAGASLGRKQFPRRTNRIPKPLDEASDEEPQCSSRPPPKKRKGRPSLGENTSSSDEPRKNESQGAKDGKKPIEIKRNESGKPMCPVCGMATRDLGMLQRHLYTHTDEKKFECPDCKQPFTRKYHLTRHLAGACTAKPEALAKASLSCCICGKVFARKDNLREHLRFHAGQTKINKRTSECEICKKVISGSITSLKIHMRTHSGEKPFLCVVCRKSFPSKASLYKHSRTHTGERPYECEECGQKFKTKEAINRHKLTHTDNKPHVCQHCGKSFIQAIQLKQHLFYHTGENGFKCSLCPKVFNRESRLRLHVSYVHENYRPYQCGECGKRFVRKNDLSRHEIFHTGIKAHACPICDKSFALKFSVTVHVRQVHETKRVCEICDKTFKRNDVYVRHMRKNHREILDRVLEEARKASLVVRADSERRGLNPSDKEVAAMALLYAVRSLKASDLGAESEDDNDENTDEEEEHRREKAQESKRRQSTRIALRALGKCLPSSVGSGSSSSSSEDEEDDVGNLEKRRPVAGCGSGNSKEDSHGTSSSALGAAGSSRTRDVEENIDCVGTRKCAVSEEGTADVAADGVDLNAGDDVDEEANLSGGDLSDLEDEDDEFLSDEDLQSAITELMTILIEDVTLTELGWPHASCDELLKSVIRQCGLTPVTEDLAEDLGMRLRHNATLLFTTVVDSPNEVLLKSKTVDEIILHVLRNAKTQDDA